MAGTYRIKYGDTLSQIAKTNGTTVEELATLNNIKDVNMIKAGATLKLPDGGEVNNSEKPKEPKSYSDIDLSKYDSGYQESDDVIAADQKKVDAENAVNNYGDFSYSKQDTFDDVMNKILNREPFSYDLNGDALYQQYKDKYIQQGKMAMQDTMGQAAAMTGGYGNSYASTAGNQAYQAHLNNLNDVIPELYQMAYDKYNQEGQDLYNQYGMLSDDRNMEYGMWGDGYNRAIADRDYYGNEANNAYAKDYGEWADNRTHDTEKYWKETEFGYAIDETNKGYARQDAYAMIQAGIMPSDAVLEAAGISKTDAQKIVDTYKTGSGGSGSGTGGGSGSGGFGGGTQVGGSGDTDATSGVPQQIVDGMKKLKTNNAKADYLAGLVNDGTISKEEAQELLAQNQNTTKDFKDRTWTVVSDGGWNLVGVDNDAIVKDQYGNKYRLDVLVKKLVAEGMTEKEANKYVKKLQQDLGISSNWLFGW